jgi:FlaA1/EpsC-like NDP-sugar epimerase
MGASKLLCEKLVTEACLYKGKRRTKFCCVRFGNVLGSRGSVTEVFSSQIAQGGPVTITHPEMTRFVMLLPQAVGLVFNATKMAKGGETFILKMHSLRIVDLAEVMIEEMSGKYSHSQKNLRLKIVGIRAGEKLHEELMTSYELANSSEFENMFVLSAKRSTTSKNTGNSKTNVGAYTSADVQLLSKAEIKALLHAMKVI